MRKIIKAFSVLLILPIILGLIFAGSPLTARAQANEKIDVLINFNRTPGKSEVQLVEGVGGKVRHSYTIVPAVAATIPAQALEGLSRNPRITVIERDQFVQLIDPVSSEAIAVELANTWGVKHIGAGEVHTNGVLGATVKVAVIDSGIDYNHPELIEVYKGGHNFINGTSNPYDDNGHGTHVSGTIAAARNGNAVVGVSPQVELYALKVLDSSGGGQISGIISAIEWSAQNGMQVTNNSYGTSQDPGTIFRAAYDNSAALGVLHIGSAGNSGTRSGKGNNVSYPAQYSSVVAVAATDQNDSRASFSSTGPAVEISAPGVSIVSTVPGGYASYNGTSMASPHVVGVAALMLSVNPQLSPSEVRAVLGNTAKPLGDMAQYGKGLVSATGAVASVTPPVTPDPAIISTVSFDKNEYTPEEDSATVTIKVTDETNSPITGLDAGAFATTLNGEPFSITLTESTSGNYVGTVSLINLALGNYSFEVTVVNGELSSSASAGFSINEAPSIVIVSATDISYVIAKNNRNMIISVSLVDANNLPVLGSTVAVVVYKDGIATVEGSATTGSNGIANFDYNNAPAGTYSTEITSVSVQEGYMWDGLTPQNGVVKNR